MNAHNQKIVNNGIKSRMNAFKFEAEDPNNASPAVKVVVENVHKERMKVSRRRRIYAHLWTLPADANVNNVYV